MNDDKVLKDLKDKIGRLKTDKAQKEGERNAVFAQIKKDFSVKTIEEAYEKLSAMSDSIEGKKERKEELLVEASKLLENYR